MLARYLWGGPAVEKVHYFGFVLPSPVAFDRIPQADWVGVATPDDRSARAADRRSYAATKCTQGTIVPVMAKGKTAGLRNLSGLDDRGGEPRAAVSSTLPIAAPASATASRALCRLDAGRPGDAEVR